jgi:hypothetical protein
MRALAWAISVSDIVPTREEVIEFQELISGLVPDDSLPGEFRRTALDDRHI